MSATASGYSARSVLAVLAALIMVGTLLMGASPVVAQQEQSSGTAAGAGDETVFDHADPEEHPDCLPVHEAAYEIDVVGTFTAVDGSTVSNYEGVATITVEAEDFYITPDGTHATAGCEGPEPVQATVEVTSPTNGIVCAPAAGTLLRENFAIFEVEWDQNCEVNGVSTGTVHHVFEGDQQPCGPDPFELLPEGACDDIPLVHGVWSFPNGLL